MGKRKPTEQKKPSPLSEMIRNEAEGLSDTFNPDDEYNPDRYKYSFQCFT